MDFSINRQKIDLCACVFDSKLEIPTDNEIILPEYCPDMARILRCTAEARITSRLFTKDTLEIEGTLTCNIIYVDSDEGEIRSYAFTTQFSKSVEADSESREISCETEACAERISCRMLNSRKADIHATVMLSVKIFSNEAAEAVVSADGIDLEAMTATEQNTRTLCTGEKYITLNEEIELPSSMKTVRCIVRTDARIASKECRVVGDKTVSKGELAVKILYTTDTKMRLEKYETTLSFSQVTDCAEIDPDAECFPEFTICSIEARPRTGMDGECHSVIISARIMLLIKSVTRTESTLLNDAYSPSYETELSRKTVICRKSLEPINESYICKKAIEIPHELAAVLDVWCESGFASAKIISGKTEVCGSVKICVLASDTDGIPVYSEQSVDYSCEYNTSYPDQAEADATVSAECTGYNITGHSEMEVKVSLSIGAAVYMNRKISFIDDITVTGKKDPSGRVPLTLCYADEGETLWEIARRYNTTAGAIRCANNIDGDMPQSGKILLIPGV